ncbi:Rieske (2Fe-2S) protein [Paraburkholderia sp. HP33-1]|uniref:Rieske (2Fe-2S) protein n=1 Tax=Paraburkholderia sp. HP33-1 TaxID=2883243 RepID=UPI002DD436BB|nr:Rieske 2Fe-2S domain-containing protein [Paraburkholderia sp. HP33-1]
MLNASGHLRRPAWTRLCQLNELPQPGARGFDLQCRGTDDLFIVRCGDLLRAYRNSCPHWPGASMPWRKHAYLDSKAEHIICHGHGARFTLEDGLCVLGPCQGQALKVVPLRIEEGRYVSVLF